MSPLIIGIILIAFILTVVGIAFALTTSSQDTSKETSSAPRKIKELIEIFQNFQAPNKHRADAMAGLVDLATPEALEALTEALSHRDDPLWTELINTLPKLGQPAFTYISKAFRNVSSRPAVLRMMQNVGPNSARWMLPYLNDPSLKTQHEAVLAMEKCSWLPGKDALSAAYWIAKHEFANCIPIGEHAVQPLIDSLKNSEAIEGAVMALGAIGDVRAGPYLLKVCKESRYIPLVVNTIAKWGLNCLPFVLPTLTDPENANRLIGLEILDAINWNPPANEDGARYWIAKNRWEKCADIGGPAVKPLIEVVQGNDTELRQSAIQALGLIEHDEALNCLIDTLNDPDPAIQLASVISLGCFKKTESAEALVGILGKDILSSSAAKSLENIGIPAIDPLIISLKSSDTKVRIRSAQILKILNWQPETQEDQIFHLIALQDWDAVARLGGLAFELLVKELERAESCGSAAEALVKISDPRVVGAIISAMKGKPSYAQRELAEALGKLGARAVDSILEAFKQDDAPIYPLVLALGKTGDPRSIEPLTSFLGTRIPIPIRDIAAEALGDFGLPAVDPILSAMVHQGLEPRSAGTALGRAGAKARDRIIAAMNNKRFDIQTLVIALGKIPDSESARAIINVMHSGESARFGVAIRTTAQESLLEIGSRAVNPLIEALSNYPSDQAAFIPVLVKMESIALGPLLSTLKTSSQSWQRQAIIEVLGNIGDKKAVNTLLEIQNMYPIHKNHVNEALAKIQRSG